jgi:hypothetical protein
MSLTSAHASTLAARARPSFAGASRRPARPRVAGRLSRSHVRPHVRSAPVRASSDADADLSTGVVHAQYVRDAAGIAPPSELGALAAVLQAQGMTLVRPSERKGLHPLCVPVAANPARDETVCLRVNPENPNGELEVVAARGIHLRLLATSAEDFVHKAIVEEDARGDGATVVAAAAGAVGAAMYESGSFATLGKELAVYLTLRVGKFPDTMEALVRRHLDKGDEMSAFVTCDLYKGTFSTWGSPHWYLSQVYADLGRDEEARDAARFALTDCEWSTLGDVSVEKCAERSGWAGMSVDEIKAVVETRRGPNRDAFDGPKTDEQLAAEEATVLLDKVAAGEMRVTEITQRLAECYSKSDRGALAKLVMSSFTL